MSWYNNRSSKKKSQIWLYFLFNVYTNHIFEAIDNQKQLNNGESKLHKDKGHICYAYQITDS